MSATLDLTESQTLAALRTVLLALLPTGTEVFRAQINRVPQPIGSNSVEMTPVSRQRLATNIDTYTDAAGVSTVQLRQATQVGVQIDVYGPLSADYAQVIATVLRDDWACAAFAATGLPVQPLYVSDPHELPLLDGEQQYEFRWALEIALQANETVTLSQQFASTVTVGVISVDATYPP